MKAPVDSKVMYRGEVYHRRDHATGRVYPERKAVIFVGSVYGDGTAMIFACTQYICADRDWETGN